MLIKLHGVSRVLFTAFIFLSLAFFTQACEEFEYSPYEVRLNENEKDINLRNIQRIEALDISPEGSYSFILTADVQGFYEETDALVKDIAWHHADAAFVLVGGDLTDFGLAKEFKMIHKDFNSLPMPYVAVIGNHDAVNNGQEVFSAMYGDYNTSFTIGNSKFILLNTNYIEFDKKVPDLDWLERELAASEGYENVFVVSHIPPENEEFGAENTTRYHKLLSQYKVTYSLHGHNHNFKAYAPYDGTVPYVQTTTAEKREYLLFTVEGDKAHYERITF
ncbi:metallophosphoesterase family protein [Pontibacter sp. MBLB2868]|uniref:metallophosphoesterase family protein n=1 Tax=Pontibacter sp. MBLB2868 TaxID=3451555 RepID=UPI003F754160